MYQGHKNWNHWNVALWLCNDWGLYCAVNEAIRENGTKDKAARALVAHYLPSKTPDGAPYTYTSVRAALAHWDN